jgi:CheY-like chemotaxis protein
MKILVVDDDADVVRVVAAQLKLHRHEVRTATSGREALNIVHEWLPDVVICDLVMEPMDGFEVAVEINADETLDSVRLIAMSGYDDPERRQVATTSGFDAFLQKPISSGVLQHALTRPEPKTEDTE